MTTLIKAGDKVRVRDTEENRLTPRLKPIINHVVAVSKMDGGFVHFIAPPGFSTVDGGGWLPSRFEKVTSKRSKPATSKVNGFQPSMEFIICLKEGGVYKPATEPRTFSSAEQANKIARTMAEKHGGRFVVFKATGFAEMPARTASFVELN